MVSRKLLVTNTKKAKGLESIARRLIISDEEAESLLATTCTHDAVGLALLEIAKRTARLYSFVAHQTYPRPGHSRLEKRLSPEFTFAAIITSLRCTLETEQKVVGSLISITQGDLKALMSIEIDELEHILRPAGLAKQKSCWIKDGLDKFFYNQEYNIEALNQIPLDEARKKLLMLRGVGPKAVDCFLLLGLERPVFPVDINIFKLVSRLFPEHITEDADQLPKFSNAKHVRAVKDLLEASFPEDVGLYQVLHTYLLLAEKYKIAL